MHFLCPVLYRTTHFLTLQPQDLLALNIEGVRLRLITISENFENDIFKEFTSEITRYMFPSSAKDIQETRHFIAESKRSMRIGNNLQFVIVSKPAGEFLGCCGLHGEGKIRTPELGIWIKKAAHGKGYGKEAIQTLVSWTWNNIDLDYLIYPVDRKNIASCKIPESLGGEIIKELKIETPTCKILDEVIYKIERVDSLIQLGCAKAV
jgi:RimJ/RimL family protein N-acetyltransferase